MRLSILLALVVVVIGMPAWADDTAMGAVGGTLQPMTQHPSVRMVSEDVRVKIGPEKIDVACRFIFRNEGKAADVRMGFPEDHGGDSSGFVYFRARVDGIPVKVTHVKTKPKDMEDYREWWVKTVHFGAGQTRVVEDFYGGRASGDSMGGTYAVYVLQTGRAWKGPIGHATIRMDLSAVRDFQTFIPYPAGYRRHGDILTWEWRDIEPRNDIRLIYTWNHTRFIVDGKDINQDLVCHRSWPPEMRSPVPRVVNGLLMVPFDMIEQVLPGTDCERTSKGRNAALISYGKRLLLLKEGSRIAYLDGKGILLPRAPRVGKDGLEFPIVSVGQALGFKITRDHASGKTYINSPPERRPSVPLDILQNRSILESCKRSSRMYEGHTTLHQPSLT